MRMIWKPIPLVVASMLTAIPAWAADDVQKSNSHKILEGLLPLLFILSLLYFFMRRVNKRNVPYMERAMVHMERLEKQNEEIIILLKEIACKKLNPEPSTAPYSEPASRSPQG